MMQNESAFIELAKENLDDSRMVCYCTWPEESGDVIIKHYSKGKLIRGDVTKQLETKNLAQCIPLERGSDSRIDTDLKPFKARCPGSFDGDCSKEERTWTCINCNKTLQFCSRDRELYCNCGHAPTDRFRFRCRSDAHGSDFKYNDEQLLSPLYGHALLI